MDSANGMAHTTSSTHNYEDARSRYAAKRRAIWESDPYVSRKRWSAYYYRRLREIYSFLIEPNRKVLILGCVDEKLLTCLNPSSGIAVMRSEKMLEKKDEGSASLRFIYADIETYHVDETFDYIVLPDILNDLWDIQSTLENCRAMCHARSRIIINCYSRLWQLPLALVRKLGLARPVGEQNWVTVEDLTNLLELASCEVLRYWSEVLFPLGISGLSTFLNRYIGKIWPFDLFALTNFVAARPYRGREQDETQLSVSVIVPARNEAGNIADVIERIPDMGKDTEVVFVEGGSTDGSYETIKKEIATRPSDKYRIFRQSGRGKGDAVRCGFSRARGDVLIILDADLTVPPEDLPRFFTALVSNRGEFINGVRLVYPMEDRSMRFYNLIGNKLFSLSFSALLGQNIKDTLCGTKALYRRDYERIARNRDYFGDFDPFGDFDLIFGAAKLNMKIIDLPIRYRQRVYGKTNISRWRDGWLLLKMVLFAAFRIKFV